MNSNFYRVGERRLDILISLYQDDPVDVYEFAADYSVDPQTIRRDLRILKREGWNIIRKKRRYIVRDNRKETKLDDLYKAKRTLYKLGPWKGSEYDA